MPVFPENRYFAGPARLAVLLLASALSSAPALAQQTASVARRVIVVSVDGLRSDMIQLTDPGLLPGFRRMRLEGASTLNARVDPDYSITLPNHTGIITGRFTAGSDGHNWYFNGEPSPDQTLHLQKGSYVQSVFDVVHDRGGRTGLFATKTKLVVFDQSFSGSTGALDLVGSDNGRDKLDTYLYAKSSSSILDSFRDQASVQPYDYVLLHVAEPDFAGHDGGWGTDPVSAYGFAFRLADLVIMEILDFVESDPEYAGQTTVIVTTDHGGNGFGHSDPTVPATYTVPLMTWGVGVQAGSDLYDLNPTRVDPGPAFVTRSAAAVTPPIFNADSANLALALLGFPAVAGSTINANQDLAISEQPSTGPPVARISVAIDGLSVSVDGAASSDPDGSIVSFVWELGDGTSGVGERVGHTYSADGTYTITLTVTDNLGMTGVATRNVTVSLSAPRIVTLSFQDGVAPAPGYSGTRDTKLGSDAATKNFGSNPLLEADGSPQYTVPISWDLSQVPVGATVVEASLTLTVTNVSADAYGFYSLLRDWSESTATWRQAATQTPWQVPGAKGAVDRAAQAFATFRPYTLGTVTIPLGSAGLVQVQQWVSNPLSNRGFVIDNASAGTDGVDLASRESANSATRPRLTLTYSTDSGTPVNLPPTAAIAWSPETPILNEGVTFDATGSVDPDGTIESYLWNFGDGSTAAGSVTNHAFAQIGTYVVGLTVTDDGGATSTTQRTMVVLGETVYSISFQDGVSPTASYAGTWDTKIKSDAASTRFGGNEQLEIDGNPDYGVLLRWDLAGIPQGATVLSASIAIEVINTSPDTYEAFGLVRPWTETEADWTRATVSNNWATAGASGTADRNGTIVARVYAPSLGPTTVPLNADGLALIQNWIDRPQDNFGLILQDYAQATNGIDFQSRETANPTLRPRLTIEYTPGIPTNNRIQLISDSGSRVVAEGTGTISRETGLVSDPIVDTVLQILGSAAEIDGTDLATDREYRLLTGRNAMVVLAIDAADSSRVDRRSDGFALDRTLDLGARTIAVYVRTFGRGSSNIDVPAGGRIFIPDATMETSATSMIHELPDTGAELSAWPNPFGSSLNVESNSDQAGQVDLIDGIGRTVGVIRMEGGRAVVSTDHLRPGVYALRLIREGHAIESMMITKAR